MKYVNSYLSKQASADLQPLFCQSKNPLKEISESYAAWYHLRDLIKKDPTHCCLFIGDGSLGMTAAMFAFFTKLDCFAIDPLINTKKIVGWKLTKQVKNLFCYKAKWQDFHEGWKIKTEAYSSYSIICVHSHITLNDVIRAFPKWDYIYTNPCCNRDKQILSLAQQKEVGASIVVTGVDDNIISEKNEVIVYKNERRN